MKKSWNFVKKKRSAGGSGSIKRRLTGAVLIPSITLLIMWAAISSYMLLDGFIARQSGLLAKQVSIPSVNAMAALQKERQLGLVYMSRPGVASRDQLHQQEQQTEQLLVAYRKLADPVVKDAPGFIKDRMLKLHQLLDQLPTVRTRIDAGNASIDQNAINDYYNKTLDAATDLFYAYTRVDGLPVTTTQEGTAGVDLFHVTDTMSRAVSHISTALANGNLTAQDHLDFTRLVGTYHAELEKSMLLLPRNIQDSFQSYTASPSWKTMTAAENAIIEHGSWTRVPQGVPGFPANEVEWLQWASPVAQNIQDLDISSGNQAADKYFAEGTQKLQIAAVGSLVALLAAIAAIITAVRISGTLVDRTLVTRLRQLQNDALQLGNRLPDIVKRLRDGQAVDVKAEIPELNYGTDEIGRLATEFNNTQYTAVAAAVNEARARDGVHNVFLGIAHRNQGLVHRQLQILDEMEREEESPKQLERLFQLDHFATQSRRNAENLMILGGEQPGRRWHKPAPLVDVVRAAVAETEQYSRVQVERVPTASVVGSAVADLIHMIAELVDNATSFSPKSSQVHVTSTLVARGIVIEVEDQGLGMSEDVRERANTMMAQPPEFDAMALRADPRLGLFVVARLAARLGAKLEFRVSPYGGTRVIVLISSQILASDGQSSNSASETDDRQRLSRRFDHVQNPQAEDDDNNQVANGSDITQHLAARRRHMRLRGTEEGTDVQPSLDTQRPIPAVSKQHPVSSQQGNLANGEVRMENADPAHRPQLPQRRPQQNIAPQLRKDDSVEMTAPSEGRSPDEIRRSLAAFQKGSQDGRQAGESVDSHLTDAGDRKSGLNEREG